MSHATANNMLLAADCRKARCGDRQQCSKLQCQQCRIMFSPHPGQGVSRQSGSNGVYGPLNLQWQLLGAESVHEGMQEEVTANGASHGTSKKISFTSTETHKVNWRFLRAACRIPGSIRALVNLENYCQKSQQEMS